MEMVEPLAAFVDNLETTIKAAEKYRDDVRETLDRKRAEGSLTQKVETVWEWQLDAAENLLVTLDGAVWDDVQRIVEQDFILRQPNAAEILI